MWSMRPRLFNKVAYSRFPPMLSPKQLTVKIWHGVTDYGVWAEEDGLRVLGADLILYQQTVSRGILIQVPIHCANVILQIFTVHWLRDDISCTLERFKSKKPYSKTLHETEGRRGETWEFSSLFNYAGTIIWNSMELINSRIFYFYINPPIKSSILPIVHSSNLPFFHLSPHPSFHASINSPIHPFTFHCSITPAIIPFFH